MNNNKPSDLAEKMMTFLDCPCEYFAPMEDDTPLMEAFQKARAQGKQEGYTPVLVVVDETLWECLCMNTYGVSQAKKDAADVAIYRKETLNAPLLDGATCIRKLMAYHNGDMEETEETEETEEMEETEEDALDWDEALSEVHSGGANLSLAAYWEDRNELTKEVILAKIPTANPWEIFSWLPFGGWNSCPNTAQLMAITKYWHDSYGVVPAAVSQDILEFAASPIVDIKTAMKVALEQYAFCCDIVDQGVGSVGVLADYLTQSDVWYFWWD